MQLETLSCNNCGAPISVPETANYVTCAHCGSRLAVKRDETVHYTEVVEKLQQQTNQIDQKVQRLQVENELLRLDQDWEQQKKDYMISTRDGGKVEPTLSMAIWGVVGAAIVVLVTCFVLLPSSSSSGDLAGWTFILMLFAGGASIYAAISGYMKYQGYKQAEADYYQLRADVAGRLDRS